MTPERSAERTLRWTRRLTRGLPPGVAERRLDEIRADLHDHIAHERAAGVPDDRIARAVTSRLVRGLPADVAWRRGVLASGSSSVPGEGRTARRRTAARIALVSASVLVVLLAANVALDGMRWSAFDFAAAAALLVVAGSTLAVAARRAGRGPHRAAVATLGLALGAAGEADDAPGLVLFGALLLAASLALTVRRARRQP